MLARRHGILTDDQAASRLILRKSHTRDITGINSYSPSRRPTYLLTGDTPEKIKDQESVKKSNVSGGPTRRHHHCPQTGPSQLTSSLTEQSNDGVTGQEGDHPMTKKEKFEMLRKNIRITGLEERKKAEEELDGGRCSHCGQLKEEARETHSDDSVNEVYNEQDEVHER